MPNKPNRLNLRLSDVQFKQIELRARQLDMAAADYLRLLIDTDLSTDTDAVVRRLSRQVLYTSVAMHFLLIELGRKDLLPKINEESRRLAERLKIVRLEAAEDVA